MDFHFWKLNFLLSTFKLAPSENSHTFKYSEEFAKQYGLHYHFTHMLVCDHFFMILMHKFANEFYKDI